MTVINKIVSIALVSSLAGFLAACSGSSPNDKDGLPVELTPLEKALAKGDASLVSDGDIFRTEALKYIEQKNTLFHTDIQQILNLNSDGSTKADGSSLTDISWDATHDAAQLNAQFGYNAPLLFSNATHNDDSEVVRQLAIIGLSLIHI